MEKIKLRPGVKKAWLEALRSGDYKQTTGMLYDKENDSHCCLGVLCDVSMVHQNELGIGGSISWQPSMTRSGRMQVEYESDGNKWYDWGVVPSKLSLMLSDTSELHSMYLEAETLEELLELAKQEKRGEQLLQELADKYIHAQEIGGQTYIELNDLNDVGVTFEDIAWLIDQCYE